MNIKIFMVIIAVMFLINAPVQADEAADTANIRQHSGEITQVDVNLGMVVLKSDMPPDVGEVTEYRISKNDTRVTDPLDQKFLSIDDLQAGQYAVIDVVKGQEDKIVRKIVAQPYLEPGLQQAFGDLQTIDTAAGTLTLKERPMVDEMDQDEVSYFIFEPKGVVMMQDPGTEPVQLALKPADLVRVIYVVRDGKKYAQSITLYVPRASQTTVTTTTTVTR